MLASMFDEETTKKVMSKLAVLVTVVCAWIGLVMVMITSLKPVNHVALWPMLLGFSCAGAALVTGGKKTKVNLSYILFLASLWVMLNAVMGWVAPPASEGMGELVAPMMAPVSAVGGFLGVLGGLVGIMGSAKYMD
ncbi:MAG: hypothetical protein U9N44_02280 [Chloroflexota bacterium]|nr:hypothetical protein [Chloroflexota bacterium]